MFFQIGRYFILLNQVFKKPDKGKILRKLITTEIDNLGIDSLGIVVMISVFNIHFNIKRRVFI